MGFTGRNELPKIFQVHGLMSTLEDKLHNNNSFPKCSRLRSTICSTYYSPVAYISTPCMQVDKRAYRHYLYKYPSVLDIDARYRNKYDSPIQALHSSHFYASAPSSVQNTEVYPQCCGAMLNTPQGNIFSLMLIFVLSMPDDAFIGLCILLGGHADPCNFRWVVIRFDATLVLPHPSLDVQVGFKGPRCEVYCTLYVLVSVTHCVLRAPT